MKDSAPQNLKQRERRIVDQRTALLDQGCVAVRPEKHEYAWSNKAHREEWRMSDCACCVRAFRCPTSLGKGRNGQVGAFSERTDYDRSTAKRGAAQRGESADIGFCPMFPTASLTDTARLSAHGEQTLCAGRWRERTRACGGRHGGPPTWLASGARRPYPAGAPQGPLARTPHRCAPPAAPSRRGCCTRREGGGPPQSEHSPQLHYRCSKPAAARGWKSK